MYRAVSMSLLFAAAVVLSGCGYLGLAVAGSGLVVEQDYRIDGFTAVEAGSGFDVDVRPGDAWSVLVRTDDNILPLVIVEREGSTLVISLEPGQACFPTCLRAIVTTPLLERLDLGGGSTGYLAAGFSTADGFSARLSGGSRLSIGRLECGSLEATLSGGSRLAGEILCPLGRSAFTLSGGSEVGALRGGTALLSLEQSGGGYTDLSAFAAERAVVSLSGGAKARVDVAASLEVALSGGSSLEYRRREGGPTFASIAVSGGSSIGAW